MYQIKIPIAIFVLSLLNNNNKRYWINRSFKADRKQSYLSTQQKYFIMWLFYRNNHILSWASCQLHLLVLAVISSVSEVLVLRQPPCHCCQGWFSAQPSCSRVLLHLLSDPDPEAVLHPDYHQGRCCSWNHFDRTVKWKTDEKNSNVLKNMTGY